MIRTTFEETHDEEWVDRNIDNPNHELIILRRIIPWERICKKFEAFYVKGKGPEGKSLRVLISVLIIARFFDAQ